MRNYWTDQQPLDADGLPRTFQIVNRRRFYDFDAAEIFARQLQMSGQDVTVMEKVHMLPAHVLYRLQGV